MKQLFTCLLIGALFLSFTYSYAQDRKMKNKGSQTKLKGTTTNTVSDTTAKNISIGNDANTTTNATAVLANTTWKGYIGDPLNDTLVWKFSTDSVAGQSKTGETFVTSNYRTSQDTLTIDDVSGTYACLYQTGRYKFTLDGDTLNLVLIADECQGRAAALNGTKWQKVKGETAQ